MISALASIVHQLTADDKGLLAIDESTVTCNRRFAALGIVQTEEKRRAWRELIITTPQLSQSISGVILYDETIRQSSRSGENFLALLREAGILAGIKVDTGARALALHPGEKITEGLDGLRARLAEYAAMGASFAKWRAVFSIGADWPSRGCIEANAHALARYAALCQEAGLVPVVEPEVLMAGPHTLAQCAEASETVLRARVTERVQPGVVYTTFHFPESGANVITTDNSDWATNCPEYKVTAVQATRVSQPGQWQKRFRAFSEVAVSSAFATSTFSISSSTSLALRISPGFVIFPFASFSLVSK